MADGRRTASEEAQADRDQVDLAWASAKLRRLRPARPPASPAPSQQDGEPDRDQVDFSWATGWLRRLGVLGHPAPPPAEQLTLFGPPDGTATTRFGRFTVARPAPAEAEPVPIQQSAGAQWIVLLAIVAYIWLFASWTMRHHDGLGTQAFDFGLYDQGVWLLSRFKRPFVTLMGRNLFGDHTSFILLPFVPVYWLIPSGKVLLFSQAAALGLGALPTFLLAREKLRHEMLAAGIAVAYLLHPT
ncbi:MAG: DUF2079 domain-containing protein, partial [Actinomycetota bacterium]|nr:DUF2079 domain-containing protein [Actinomycetota bacterium]